MRLVACKDCHAQYDVGGMTADRIPCRCGAEIDAAPRASRDLAIHRCSSCGAHVTVGDDSCEYCGSSIVRDPRLLSLICPECCARNGDDSRFCGACGVVFDPQPIEVEKREVPCPVCSCLMPARTVGAVAINECPSCNGLWCPQGSFESLVESALESRKAHESKRSPITGEVEFKPRKTGSNPARQGVQYRKCPECDGFMMRRNFRKTSGVILDRCPQHGCWLDADELEQIAGYLLSGGRPQAERFMRETDEQAKADFRASRRANIAAQQGGRPGAGSGLLPGRYGSGRSNDSGLGGGLLGLLASFLED